MTDLTEFYHHETRVLDQHAIVSIADLAGTISYVNDRFCAISGYERDELIGQNHRIVRSDRHDADFYHQLWHTITSGETWRGTICNRRKDGGEYWVDATISPSLDDSGQPFQYISIRTDITELKLAQQRLEDSNSRVRRSQKFASIGTWDWNIQTGELYWSETIAPLFGYSEGELATTYDNFLAAIHPDDRDNVINAVNACVKLTSHYDIQHRVVWPDGQVRWVHEKGDVVCDDEGRPLNMLGVVIDIHDTKMLEQKNSTQKKLLDIVNQTITGFVAGGDLSDTMNSMLDNLIKLTASDYGFIGDIVCDAQGVTQLNTQAISHFSGGLLSDISYQPAANTGDNDQPQPTLFGQLLSSARPLVINDPVKDSATGLPLGHPPIRTFLGVPVFYGDALVGMYGLANGDGYDQALIDALQPVYLAYGAMIHASRLQQQQQHYQADLVAAKDRAEKASHAKSEFLSLMSHELKTPLNAVLGFSQLLKQDKVHPLTDDQLDSLDYIEKSGEQLLGYVNDLLAMAGTESELNSDALKSIKAWSSK